MIRYILDEYNLKKINLYDKFLKMEHTDLKTENNKNNSVNSDSDSSEHSEMYISDDDFECVDISGLNIMEKKTCENKKTSQDLECINNNTGILRQSFYNLGKYLLNCES